MPSIARTSRPSAGESVRLTLAHSGTVDGRLQVVVIQPGTANGYTFPEGVLRARAELFNGVPVFADHAKGPRSVRDLVGMLEGAAWSADLPGVRARLSLLQSAAWLRAVIAAGLEHPALVGLSADLWVQHEQQTVTDITEVNSVDIVLRPAAGGRFLAHRTPIPEETTMPSDQVHLTTNRPTDSGLPPVLADEATGEGAGGAVLDDARRDDARAIRRELLEFRLANSRLPKELQDTVRAQFATIPHLTGADLTAMIDRLQRAWARANEQNAIRNLGRVEQVTAPVDRLSLAFEQLMGVGGTAEHRNAPRLTGIREMYDLLTGDWERQGIFRAERVTLANATTTTMAGIVANALNKVLLQAFEMRPQWWKPIAYEEDFATLNQVRWITVGGFSDLDTVAEGGSYTEKTWDDNTETSSFVKKGNYIGVTLEMIDRDDVAGVRAIPRRLGYAANRTLSAAVAALFTDASGAGPNLSDGVALFDQAHSNLGTSALSADNWDACLQAMYKQTELHSNRRLGVRPRFCLVPIELEKTALTIFTSDQIPGSPNNDANVRRYSAQVITVPEWTDANNWAAAADPAELEGVCIGYRFGRAPEIFVAQGEQMGSMFTNDEMRIKCRFLYAVGVGDYRALYKSNVAN
ncbi:MAG: hypothetical protein GX552_07875 [Chloroflexi bacterium]|nr:hypothetical protein [Chloroflexota bacterium]